MSIPKVGRNDPCPCGSGQKYKRCCMARDRAEHAERVAWQRAAQDMRVALIGFAKERVFVKDLAVGLGLFWQDRYTIDTIQMMNMDESLRFFDWFTHDYTLQAAATPAGEEAPDPGAERSYVGRRLIEAYREEVADALAEKEAAILDGWIASPPASALVLEEIRTEEGTIYLRDLFLEGRTVIAHDTAAAEHGQVGQILLARPLPERDGVRLSGATVVLPAEEQEGLLAWVDQARQAYVAEHPQATEAQFLRDRAYLLTHYALEWADRMDRPAVSAEDPEALKPGGKAVRRLIKWRQERIQSLR